MKVTPVSRKFGKYAPGDVFTSPFSPKMTKVLIKLGKLSEVLDAPALTAATQAYSTRMMVAHAAVPPDYKETMAGVSEVPDPAPWAPYGYKADGTPRLRPGRPAKSE